MAAPAKSAAALPASTLAAAPTAHVMVYRVFAPLVTTTVAHVTESDHNMEVACGFSRASEELDCKTKGA